MVGELGLIRASLILYHVLERCMYFAPRIINASMLYNLTAFELG